MQIKAVVSGIRGLGRAAVRVLALAPRRSAAGLWSRYTGDRLTGPDAMRDPRAYAKTVACLARERGPLVVYPGREESIEALLDAHDTLPPEVVLPYPSVEALRAIRHKPSFPARAEAVGLSAPKTFLESTAGELERLSVPMPCIIKPGKTFGWLASSHLVHSPEQMRAVFASLKVPPEERVLVQEPLQGPLTSLELVISRDGEVLSRFQQVTHRTHPATAGSIAYAVSAAPDDDLVSRAAALLRATGYWGLAQLDFLRGARGPALVDVNTRFYTCLPLALACGVNLPAAWHAVATGSVPRRSGGYPTGVGFRWLEGDVLAALRGEPGRLLLRPPRRTAGAMWVRDDPIPGFMLGAGAITLRVRRRLPRRETTTSQR